MRKEEKEDIVVLKYKGWIIRKIPHNYVVHHEKDEKMNHAVYPSSLDQAFQILHEKILLSKMKSKNYDGSLAALKQAIQDTHREFAELLTPHLPQALRRIKEDERNEGH